MSLAARYYNSSLSHAFSRGEQGTAMNPQEIIQFIERWETSGAAEGANSERIQAVRAVIAESATPLSANQVAARFTRAKLTDIQELLSTLAVLGHVQEVDDDIFCHIS